MANTEQIEAKLCAYVDGELDAAARAEIEQHLAANPQHRALLEELMAQREMLRGLPRENAPDDLYDSFQTHLERSVLLDAKQPRKDVAGRINPWPQVFSIAAVLLLAVGLFAVIYFVLPSQQSARDYATLSSTAPAPTQPVAEGVGGPTTMALAAAPPPAALPAPSVQPPPAPARVEVAAAPPPAILPETVTNAARPDIFSADTGTRSIAGKKEAAAERGGFGTVDALFEAPPLEPEIERRVKESPHVPQNSMLLVVASANPAATDRQVTDYLAQEKIRWDDMPERMPAPVAMKQSEVYASKIQRKQSAELKDIATKPRGKGDVPPPGDDLDKDAIAKAAPAATPSLAPSAPAAAAPSEAAAAVTEDEKAQQLQIAQAPSTQIAAQAPAFAQERLRQASDDFRQQGEQSQLPTTQRFIVARGLTRSQIAELNTSLITQNAGKLTNYRCSDGSITPVTPALAGSISLHTLDQTAATTRREELDREAGFAMKMKSLEPTTQTSFAGKPSAPASAAASQPAAAGQQKITLAAGSRPAATAPGRGANALSDLTTALDSASTQPATAPSPADERLDVVIVVKPAVTGLEPPVPAAPATSPATTNPHD